MRCAPTSVGGSTPTSPSLAMLAWLPSSSLRRSLRDQTKPFHDEATRRLISDFDPAQDFQAANTARTLDPRTLAMALEQLLPRDRNLVVDSGNFLSVVPYLSVPDPGCFKMTA